MLVSIALRYVTPDVEAAGQQVVAAFEPHLVAAARAVRSTTDVSEISFSLSFFNPLTRVGEGAERAAEYSWKQKAYYAPVSLIYDDYVRPDWSVRIEGLHRAAVRSLDATSTYSLPRDLKEALLVALRLAADSSLSQAPATVEQVEPVWLMFEGDDPRPSVALQRPAHISFGAWRFVEVTPVEVDDVRARYFSVPEASTMFRRYRGDGELQYREAWMDDDAVVEHWGVVGNVGETRRYEVGPSRNALSILADLETSAEGAGFEPIPIERHRCVQVRTNVAGDGSVDDLDLRHRLEEALNEALGGTGLGYCDGGDIGGGQMTSFNYVVDLNLGLKVIAEVLETPDYRRFRVEIGR